MAVAKNDPIYPISVAAKLLGVHPRTIRIYEEEGLIKPARQGQKRYFSNDDIDWIQCLRYLIHDEGISIPGIKKLLALSPCWEIKGCPPEKRDNCSAFIDKTGPCWERKNTACAKDSDSCQSCSIFIEAMKEAKEKAAAPGAKPDSASQATESPDSGKAPADPPLCSGGSCQEGRDQELEQDAGIPLFLVDDY